MVSDIYAPAKVDVVEGELYEISTSADYIKHGSPATITVTPIGNSKVTAIVVNGVEYPVEVANGVAVEHVLNTSYASSYEVSAIVTEEVIPMYTIAIDYRTAQEKELGVSAYAIDGRTVKFVGPETKEVEIVDGKVTLSLAVGDYTVSLGNGATLSFTATENVADAVDTLNFVGKNLFEGVEAGSVAGTYKYNTKVFDSVLTVAEGTNLAGTVVTFNYTFVPTDSSVSDGQGIKLFTANNPTAKQRFNLYKNATDSSLCIKNANDNNEGDKITGVTGNITDAEVKLVISEDGKTLTITLTYNGQTITREWTDGSCITTLQIGCAFGATYTQSYEMNNIMVSDVCAPNN